MPKKTAKPIVLKTIKLTARPNPQEEHYLRGLAEFCDRSNKKPWQKLCGPVKSG